MTSPDKTTLVVEATKHALSGPDLMALRREDVADLLNMPDTTYRNHLNKGGYSYSLLKKQEQRRRCARVADLNERPHVTVLLRAIGTEDLTSALRIWKNSLGMSWSAYWESRKAGAVFDAVAYAAMMEQKEMENR